MVGYSSKTTGWLTIAIGVVAIVGLIFLSLFLVSYFTNQSRLQKFGSYSDVVGVFPAILSAVLASILHPVQRKQSPWRSLFLLIATWVGAIFVSTGSWLLLSSRSSFVLQGYYHFFGYGLIGIWLFMLNRHAGLNAIWPPHIVNFGVIASAFMMVGLLGVYGIYYGLDGNEPTPLLLGLAVSFIGHGILYTIWCILLGSWILLSKSDNAQKLER